MPSDSESTHKKGIDNFRSKKSQKRYTGTQYKKFIESHKLLRYKLYLKGKKPTL